MQTSTTQPGSMPILNTKAKASYPWLMLISPSALFLLFQTLIALILMVTGAPSAWDESARWWTFVVSLANFGSFYLLVNLFKAEGKNFWDILRFSRETWKTDLLYLLGFSIIGFPLLPRRANRFPPPSLATQ